MPKIRAARVVEVAAVVQAEVVVAWAAADLPAAKVVVEADALVAVVDKVEVVVVDVLPVVEVGADKVAADKVAADDRAVVDKAVAVVVDVLPVVEVGADKAVVVAVAVLPVEVGADKVAAVEAGPEVEAGVAKVVVDKVEEAAVVAPAVVGAAGIANSSCSTGRLSWRPVLL